jgi:hypothetical protein
VRSSRSAPRALARPTHAIEDACGRLRRQSSWQTIDTGGQLQCVALIDDFAPASSSISAPGRFRQARRSFGAGTCQGCPRTFLSTICPTVRNGFTRRFPKLVSPTNLEVRPHGEWLWFMNRASSQHSMKRRSPDSCCSFRCASDKARFTSSVASRVQMPGRQVPHLPEGT